MSQIFGLNELNSYPDIKILNSAYHNPKSKLTTINLWSVECKFFDGFISQTGKCSDVFSDISTCNLFLFKTNIQSSLKIQ